MEWVYDIVNRQGVRLAQVTPTGGRWQTRVNSIGSGSHTFLPADSSQGLTGAEWVDLTRPGGDRILVVSRVADNAAGSIFAVYAGLIDGTDYDYGTGVLTVNHRELRSILADRYGVIVPLYSPTGKFEVAGKSLRGVARAVIEKGLISTPGNNWHFPVVLPADQSGTVSKTWHHHKFASIEDMLAEVQNTDGGPDIAFDAVWSGLRELEWWARIGSPRIPGDTFEWSVSAAESAVIRFAEKVDSSKQKSGVFSPGAGSEVDMLVGTAGNITGTSMPDRDAVVSEKSLESDAELDAYALANLRAHREPTRSFTFSLDASDLPVGDTFRLGARARLWVGDDTFLAEGWREGYVIGVSGDGSSRIGVEVQP